MKKKYVCIVTTGQRVVVEHDHDPVSHLVYSPVDGKKCPVVRAREFVEGQDANPHGSQSLVVVAHAPSHHTEPEAAPSAPPAK